MSILNVLFLKSPLYFLVLLSVEKQPLWNLQRNRLVVGVKYPLALGYLSGCIIKNTDWSVQTYNADFNAEKIAVEALNIAAEICIYTNQNVVIEKIEI